MRANKRWTAEHFSQANPAGPEQGNIPALLRRVAETVEGIGPINVQDLILHTEVTDDGPWHSLTVYFHRPRATRSKRQEQRRMLPPPAKDRRAASPSRPTSRSTRSRVKRAPG